MSDHECVLDTVPFVLFSKSRKTPTPYQALIPFQALTPCQAPMFCQDSTPCQALIPCQSSTSCHKLTPPLTSPAAATARTLESCWRTYSLHRPLGPPTAVQQLLRFVRHQPAPPSFAACLHEPQAGPQHTGGGGAAGKLPVQKTAWTLVCGGPAPVLHCRERSGIRLVGHEQTGGTC